MATGEDLFACLDLSFVLPSPTHSPPPSAPASVTQVPRRRHDLRRQLRRGQVHRPLRRPGPRQRRQRLVFGGDRRHRARHDRLRRRGRAEVRGQHEPRGRPQRRREQCRAQRRQRGRGDGRGGGEQQRRRLPQLAGGGAQGHHGGVHDDQRRQLRLQRLRRLRRRVRAGVGYRVRGLGHHRRRDHPQRHEHGQSA